MKSLRNAIAWIQKIAVGGGAASLVLVAVGPRIADAHSSLRSNIPYGTTYSCLACHANTSNYALGPFGNDFNNNGRTWNSVLARKDSDGDGYVNGVEFQDARGVWRTGQGNPGEQNYTSNPNQSSSKPNIPSRAAILDGILGKTSLPVPSDITTDGVTDACDLFGHP